MVKHEGFLAYFGQSFCLCVHIMDRRVSSLSKKTCKYKVRSFEDGDEIEIVRLFDRMYANYGGYSLKTPEYWRWCCLGRPDVEREGLFMAADRNENLVGYAIVGRSGNIWDLCYDPRSEGEEIVSLLLDEATRYLEKVGANSITFNAPKEDYVVNRVCRKVGFAVISPPKMFLSILDFRKLLSLLAKCKKEKLMTRFDEAVLVKLKNAPFWINDTVFIKISREGVQVGYEPQSPTIQMETDITTFSSLLFGIMSPFQSLIHLKLRVKPFWKTPTLLKLLSSLRLKTTWFFPLSDYG